jgi:hypothetical protein
MEFAKNNDLKFSAVGLDLEIDQKNLNEFNEHKYLLLLESILAR